MENPIVQVQQGQLRGIYDTNVNGKSFIAFKGVPYATAPVGELRFKVNYKYPTVQSLQYLTKLNQLKNQQVKVYKLIIKQNFY